MYIQGAMLMQVQIKSWGNSRGIRLSKESLAVADFREGDIPEMPVSQNQIALQKAFVHKRFGSVPQPMAERYS